eukprot:TRINITY_DN23534_c0_g1_i8.p1 TRINITY_DN23534_c0_g1~~TRINITY_DN23534_c0_g1_i8.p1  ORF type:complete len:684 (-),score=131.34 TRINITY_DN23534_c0_g1_i8:291-2342(-)
MLEWVHRKQVVVWSQLLWCLVPVSSSMISGTKIRVGYYLSTKIRKTYTKKLLQQNNNKLREFKRFQKFHDDDRESVKIRLDEDLESDDIQLDFNLDHLTEEDLNGCISKAAQEFFSQGDADGIFNVPVDPEIVDEVRNFVKSNRSYLPNDPKIEEESQEVLNQLLEMGMADNDPELWQELAVEAGATMQEYAKNYYLQRIPFDVLDKVGQKSGDFDIEINRRKEPKRGRAYSNSDPKPITSIQDGEDLERDWESHSQIGNQDSEIEQESDEFDPHEPELASEEVVTFNSRDLSPTFNEEDIDYGVVNFMNYLVDRAGYLKDEEFPYEQQMPPEGATEIIEMGMWRLRPLMNDVFSTLVANVEGTWRHHLGLGDLRLYPIEQKWKIMDSMDRDFKHNGESYSKIPNPEEDDKKFPRLLVENRYYTTVAFRKLHIEVAYRQDGVRILHVVMFPRPSYELPIFQMDVVEFDERITFMCMDMGPVTYDRKLPVEYSEMMKVLMNQNRLRPTAREDLPEWAQEIFSDYCLMFRPTCSFDIHAFIRYVLAMLKVHMVMAQNSPQLEEEADTAEPAQEDEDEQDEEKTDDVKSRRDTKAIRQEVDACHKRMCEQHLKNLKTRRMLESSFGKKMTEDYMTKCMFDYHEDGEQWQLDRIRLFLDAWSKEQLGVSQVELEKAESAGVGVAQES